MVGSQPHFNHQITPFYIHMDTVDPWGNFYRGGTLFTYMGGTLVQASLSVRSLQNMFDHQNTVIDTIKYGIEPYQYMNIIQDISQGKHVDTATFSNGGITSNSISGSDNDPVRDVRIVEPKLKHPNGRLREVEGKTSRNGAEIKKPKPRNVSPIKKIYCPYNYDIIVYDNKNNRINDVCGELTADKFYDIMKFITKDTVFEGFDYFKEACFDLDLIPRQKEFENDDFAALEAMKNSKIVDLHGNELKRSDNEKWK